MAEKIVDGSYKENIYYLLCNLANLDNKSIVSQTFYGIVKTILNCDLCKNDEEIIYEKFNIIDIDIKSFCDYKHLKGYSLTNFDVDDFIDYYFNEKTINTNEKKINAKIAL